MHIFEMTRLILLPALVAAGLLLAVACGSSASPEPGPATQEEPAAAVETEPAEALQESLVGVSFANDVMTPETIQVKHGDKVTLNLETDRPGTFHIHGYDLEQEAAVGEVTQFEFVANATGRFRINFHAVAEPEKEMAAGMGMDVGGNVAEASMSGMEHPASGQDKSGMSSEMSPDMSAGGGHDMNSMASGAMDHGTMDHGPAESAVPVHLDITAEVGENGGIHVAIDAEGWRWAPEEVNGANSDGAGHAHIYADGVKLSRVYGPYHYIPELAPGEREIKVSLNSNDHSELTWQGEILESAKSVTVPEMLSMSHHDMGSMMDPVETVAPMSVEVIAHEDELGGYNLQVISSGFEFSQSADQAHAPGKGYAVLSIDGEEFNRLYVPWLQVPAQGEGMHTFAVALLNNEGRPYEIDGQPVEASVQVHEKPQGDDAGGGHHQAAAAAPNSPDAMAAAGSGSGAGHHANGAGASADHHSGGHSSSVEELEVGYLEVLPR